MCNVITEKLVVLLVYGKEITTWWLRFEKDRIFQYNLVQTKQVLSSLILFNFAMTMLLPSAIHTLLWLNKSRLAKEKNASKHVTYALAFL